MKKSKFQFSNPELDNLSFAVNDLFDKSEFDGISIESQTDVQLSEENRIANVIFTMHIGDKTEAQPFDILITMSADFRWEEDLEELTLKKLLQSNAPAVLLSYIRPIVSNLTAASKYPALNIPFLDMTNNEINVIEQK